MLAFWLRRPMMAFLIIYLLMALGIGCIVELELHHSPEDRTIPPQSVAPDLVTAAVETSHE